MANSTGGPRCRQAITGDEQTRTTVGHRVGAKGQRSSPSAIYDKPHPKGSGAKPLPLRYAAHFARRPPYARTPQTTSPVRPPAPNLLRYSLPPPFEKKQAPLLLSTPLHSLRSTPYTPQAGTSSAMAGQGSGQPGCVSPATAIADKSGLRVWSIKLRVARFFVRPRPFRSGRCAEPGRSAAFRSGPPGVFPSLRGCAYTASVRFGVLPGVRRSAAFRASVVWPGLRSAAPLRSRSESGADRAGTPEDRRGPAIKWGFNGINLPSLFVALFNFFSSYFNVLDRLLDRNHGII